jgi:GNAT superfamily N-acetyltransferase
VEQTRALEALCRVRDGLKVSLFLDSSLNFSQDIPCLITSSEDGFLTGVAAFFAPRHEEAEIVCLTHPDFRRKGVFRTLVAASAEQCAAFGISDLLFICEPQSASGIAALGSLGVKLEYTEYSLRFDRKFSPDRLRVLKDLTLRRAGIEDLDILSSVSGASFQEDREHARQMIARVIASDDRAQYLAHLGGEPVGIVSTGLSNAEITIYGLGVTPGMQGKGIGRGILSLLLKDLLERHTGDILIEVDSVNSNALHLYLTSGFVADAVFGYYRARAERFLPHP